MVVNPILLTHFTFIMANKTTYVKTNNIILLEKNYVIEIINQIKQLKQLLIFDFEDDEQSTEDKLIIAKEIINCDVTINYLNSKLN